MKPSILLRSALFTAACLLASRLPSTAQVVNGSFEDLTSPYFTGSVPLERNPGNPYSNQYDEPYTAFPTTVMFNGWEGASHQGGIRYQEISTATYTGAQSTLAVNALDGGANLESYNPVATIQANETYTLTLAVNAPSGVADTTFSLLATTQGTDPNSYQYYSYSQGENVTGPSPNPLIQTLANGVLASGDTASGSPTGANQFVDYTISFNTLNGANSGFVGKDLSIDIGLGQGASVTDISLAVVPEPSTWALMFAGAAGLLFIGRRKLNA